MIDNPTLRDVVNMLFKHKRLIMLVFAVVVGLTLLVNLTKTPVYESTAQIILKFGREHVVKPEVGNDRPQVDVSTEDLVNTELEILRNQTMAKMTIERIGLDRLYPGIDRPPPWSDVVSRLRWQLRQALSSQEGPASALDLALHAFSNDLTVEPVAKSTVVTIAFADTNADLAAEVVNAHIENYKLMRLRVFADTSSVFLDAQRDAFKQSLEKAEAEHEAFRQKTGIYDYEQQRTLLLEQRGDLITELQKATNDIDENSRRLETLQAQKRTTPSTIPLSTVSAQVAVADAAATNLLNLRAQRQQMVQRYKESTPFVQDIDRQIAAAESQANALRTGRSTSSQSGKNPVYEQIEIQMSMTEATRNAAQARKTAIESQLDQISNELAKFDMHYNELRRITRDVTNFTTQYETYLTKANEASVGDLLNESKISSVSVASEARPSISPIAPRKTLNLLMAIFFGTAFGFLLAYLAEKIRAGIISPEAAAREIGVPVIGTISYRS